MSLDHQALVVRLRELQRHPDADTLSIVTVLGDYPCIVRTAEWATGDIAVREQMRAAGLAQIEWKWGGHTWEVYVATRLLGPRRASTATLKEYSAAYAALLRGDVTNWCGRLARASWWARLGAWLVNNLGGLPRRSE